MGLHVRYGIADHVPNRYALALPLLFWMLTQGSPGQGVFENGVAAARLPGLTKELFAHFEKIIERTLVGFRRIWSRIFWVGGT